MRTTPTPTLRIARALGLAAGIGLALLAPGPAAAAEGPAPASLARYVPSEDLIGYVEFDGLDAHADAWQQVGRLQGPQRDEPGRTLEDMLRQLVDGRPPPR